MKKLICLLLSLLVLLCVAAAETTSDTERSNHPETETINQDCYVSLQLIFEQPSGENKEIFLQVKAFTVQYALELYKNPADDSYSGFRYDPETIVSLINMPPKDASFYLPLMNLTAEIKEVPRNYSFTSRPGDYFLQLDGGLIELTYNRILHFNFLGELTETIPVTENHAFHYSNIPFPLTSD